MSPTKTCFVWFIHILINSISSTTFFCNQTICDFGACSLSACQGNTYICSDFTKECSLRCNGCNNIAIQSSADYTELICHRQSSCQDITISITDPTDKLYVECSKRGSCTNIDVTCQDSTKCQCEDFNFGECTNNVLGDWTTYNGWVPMPTVYNTQTPTLSPSTTTTSTPTGTPTVTQTTTTAEPTTTTQPSLSPTTTPSSTPTAAPVQSTTTANPTNSPLTTSIPSKYPTNVPTTSPSDKPTQFPTPFPTTSTTLPPRPSPVAGRPTVSPTTPPSVPPTLTPTKQNHGKVPEVTVPETKPNENKVYIDEHEPSAANTKSTSSKFLALIIGVPLFWVLVCIAVPLYIKFYSKPKRNQHERVGEGVGLPDQSSIDLQRIASSASNLTVNALHHHHHLDVYDEPEPDLTAPGRRSSEGNRTKRTDVGSEAGSHYPASSVAMMDADEEEEQKQTEMDGNVSETEEQSNYDAMYEGGSGGRKKVTAGGGGDIDGSGKQEAHVTPGAPDDDDDEVVKNENGAVYTIPMATMLTPKTALSALTVDLPASAMSDKESLLGCSIGSPEDNFHLLYGPGNKVTAGEDSD